MVTITPYEDAELDRFGNLKPGIYSGVPDDVYHSSEAPMGRCCSTSSWILPTVTRSPRHALAQREKKEETLPMREGKAFHAHVEGCLEDVMIEVPVFRFGSNEDKQAVVDWAASAGLDLPKLKKDEMLALIDEYLTGLGRVRVTTAQWAMYQRMTKSIAENAATAKYLDDAVLHHEVTIIWYCPRTGERCKGRLDALALGASAWSVDWKSTRDAVRYERELVYDRKAMQAVHYMAGASALGLELDGFAFCAVEKEEPSDLLWYEFPADHSIYGDWADAYYKALMQYKVWRCGQPVSGYRQEPVVPLIPRRHQDIDLYFGPAPEEAPALVAGGDEEWTFE